MEQNGNLDAQVLEHQRSKAIVSASDCQDLRSELEGVIPDIAAKYGFTARIGAMHFTPTSVHCSLDLFLTPRSVQEYSSEELAKVRFQNYASMFNGEPEWWMQFAIIHGKTYQVVGVNTKARRKFFILREASTEVECRTDAETLRAGIEQYNTKKGAEKP